MKGKPFSGKLTRRQFISAGGVSLAGLALSCGGGKGIEPLASDSTPKFQMTPGQEADTLFFNGKIFTVDKRDTQAQALAIRDGVIQAVGNDTDLMAFSGSTTQKIRPGWKSNDTRADRSACAFPRYGPGLSLLHPFSSALS